MESKAEISRELTFIFFISILAADWLYILGIQKEAPIISHWFTALPMVTILLFAMTLLALIGMYYSNVWGFVLAYTNIILSMYFSYVSYESIPTSKIRDDWEFIILIAINLVVFLYLAFFHYYTSNNNEP